MISKAMPHYQTMAEPAMLLFDVPPKPGRSQRGGCWCWDEPTREDGCEEAAIHGGTDGPCPAPGGRGHAGRRGLPHAGGER
jgi:hypothetical protein